MKISHLILFVLLVVAGPLQAGSSTPVSYTWSDYEDWYYKKTATYQGWKYIVVHHSATQAGSVNAFHRFHTKQGYGGVAYHFVIGNGKGMQDGEVQETFRWKQQISGTHVSVNAWKHNIFGIGICLVGNLDNASPTKAQQAALKKLIDRLKKTHAIKSNNIYGHKHVMYDDASGRKEQTACPGKRLDLKTLNPLR